MINNDDIIGEIQETEKKISTLIKLCQKFEQTGIVGKEIRNIVEEIYVKEIRLLDKIVYGYFEKYIYPKLSGECKAKLYFPFCSSPNKLDVYFKSFKIPSINNFDPNLFSLLNKYQPYQPEYEWLPILKYYCNLGHRLVIPVVKEKIIDGLNVGSSKIITRNMNLKFTEIDGILFESLEVKDGKIVGGTIDENQKNILNFNYYFYVEGTKTDIISLSQKGYILIKKVAQDLMK